jgi:hypothetical protein
MDMAEVVEWVVERKHRKGFDQLSPAERVIFVVADADCEVTLGGATGYLYNMAGDHLADLAGAFEVLGCPKLARLADLLCAALAETCDVRNRAARYEAFRARAGDEAFGGLVDDFTAAIQGRVEDFGEALERYIEAHRDQFAGR